MARKIIELKGEVGWEITDRGLRSELPKNGDLATLKVDSFGGSVFEGNRLYNTIIDHLAKFPNSLIVEVGAIAASAASYFYLGVGVENIKVRENTVFMGHKSSIFAYGNSDEMNLKASILTGFDRMIASYYNKLTNKSIEDTLEEMKNEFWLMGGQAVIDAGFASEIIESSDIEGETKNEILEVSVVYARLEEIKNKLKEIDNKEDLEKWSAKLEIENKTESNPPLGDGNINEEDISDMAIMTLKEYLNSNPEAKAENDLFVKNAIADGIKAEKERGEKYFNLAGGAVAKELKEAYNSGKTIGEYAEDELNRQNEAVALAGDSDLGTLTVKNQNLESDELKNKNKTAAEIADAKALADVEAFLKDGK